MKMKVFQFQSWEYTSGDILTYAELLADSEYGTILL